MLFCAIPPMRVSAMKNRARLVSFGAAMVFGTALGEPALAQDSPQLLEGKAAFTDWRADRPGLRRHIRAADLPPANLAASNSNGVQVASRTGNETLLVPPGFRGRPVGVAVDKDGALLVS